MLVGGIHWIGLSLSFVGTGFTQVWSPSGLSIILLFLFGVRSVPAVLAGTAVNFLLILPSAPAALLLALAAAAEALLGSALLTRTGFDPSLRTLRDVGKLVVVSGAVSTAAGAVLGTAVYTWLLSAGLPSFPMHFLLWWTGNLVGVIVIAPAVCLFTRGQNGTWNGRRTAEFVLLLVSVAVASLVIFNGSFFTAGLHYSLAFILFPFVIISSIRFGMTGAVATLFIISLNAVLSAVTGGGLFAAERYATSILLVDVFVLVLGVTALFLAALAEERSRADRSVRISEERYRIVTERTGQLVYDYHVGTGAIHWGGAVREVTQYEPSEFRLFDFSRWLDHIHPDDRTRVSESLQTAMHQRQELRMEYRFRRKDGSYVEVLDRVAFLYRTETDREAYRMLGTMADVTVANRTMRQLQESEERYKLFSLITSDYIYSAVVTPDGLRTEWASDAFTLITGYTVEDLRGSGAWEAIVHPDDRARATRQAQNVFRNLPVVTEYRIVTKQGEVKWIRDSIKPIADVQTGTVIRMMGGVQDITERKQVEERFRILIDRSADGIMLMDKRGIIIFAGASAESIIGYAPEELIGTSIFSILHPSEAKQYTYRFGRLTVEYERSQQLFGRFRHKNGAWVYIEGMVTNLFNTPSVNAFVANFRDVTARVSAEERQQRSLKEKEILLKEVHHRVKNNMQVISSLLNLQSASLKDASAVALFRESQQRVRSMSLVHEILYQSQDLASVDFASYVKQLVDSLQRSFGARAAAVTVTVKVGSVALEMDEAIPCGLIINELVSNALKYAFPQKRAGAITVAVKQLRSSAVRLTVSDNGAGIRAQRGAADSLGLKLVRALTEQLHGTITIDTASGTAVTIEFPIHRQTAV